jgi:hypothetical protein
MNLIIISHEPFRIKMREDFYMEQFMTDGFEVSYWCVQRALKYSSNSNYLYHENSENVRYLDNNFELINELKSLKANTIVCLDIWFVQDTFEVLNLLVGLKVKLFKIDYFRNQPTLRSTGNKLVKSFKTLDLKRIFNAFTYKLDRFRFKVKLQTKGIRLDFPIFVPGQITSKETENIISITHFDVYSFARNCESVPLVKGSYYVFIDIFLPYHPDIIRAGSKSVEPHKYFKTLRTYFDDIERRTGSEVVIAAHPKAKYTDEFGKRNCFYNQTPGLINHSIGVLTHHSTAINFAVLAYKPLILLSSKIFTDTKSESFVLENIYDVMRGYMLELNCTIVDMEESFELSAFKPVNKLMYDRFKFKYLLSKEFPKSNYDIIKTELQLISKDEN